MTTRARINYLSGLFVCASLIIVTFMVFGQLSEHEFINFDDDIYVTNNNYVRAGLTAESIKWAFTTIKAEFWHPLTWLSLMFDTYLFGVSPGGYLATNLFLHILNTLLLFFIFKRMTGSLWNSCFIAALFAIHPLHVESVAFISARKDVLSTFFWMFTTLCYLNYVKNPGILKYFLILVSYMSGLMAKPMLVTLPFVFLLIDYWPLGRIRSDDDGISGITMRINSLIWEKIPLFTLSVVASALAYIAQKNSGGIGTLDTYPVTIRILNALISYMSYLFKTIWPYNLTFFYPFQPVFPTWKVFFAFILITGITIGGIKLARRCPYFIVGWLWYLGTLFPVIGLIKVGGAAMADRYTYIPLIGIFVIIAWCVPDLLKELRWKTESLTATATIILFLFIINTRVQISYWANSARLYEHAIEVTEGNYMAYNNLGNVRFREGRIDEAIDNYRNALEINPLFPEALNGMGGALVRKGKPDEALVFFQRALQLSPDNKVIKNNFKRLLKINDQ